MSGMKEIETLSAGSHSPNGKACVMEAAAYVAGEKWSDCPECVSPLLAAFLRGWNDALPSNEDRVRLLAPLIPEVLGTTAAGDAERSKMAWEWFARTYVPAWLDLVPALKGHAAILRDCPIEDIVPKLMEARKDAVAAWAAAGAAAWAADWNAARAAAWAAARAAAWNAARAAAWAAAWDADWNAARAAAGAAAWAALKPTTLKLQDSAVDLVKRMAAVERKPFPIKRSLKIGDFEMRAYV